jgi:endonuclease/exonuclease/phosphatase (EEP) superfamily protein YafD
VNLPGCSLIKLLLFWVSFSGAFFFDYQIAEKDILVQYGQASKSPLQLNQNYILTSWNVYKGANQGLDLELAQVINESDFVHVQEFLLNEVQQKQIESFVNFYWMLAKSFSDNGFWTGVATISRSRPIEGIAVRSYDTQPVTDTPKMSLISKFKIENGQELWLANTHALNFNLDPGAFQRQIDAVYRELKKHNGPIIFSGDFNTWVWPRYEYLVEKTEELGMVRAPLESPTGLLGVTMDHIFYRGLKDVKTSVLSGFTKSDHLPLRIEFKFE